MGYWKPNASMYEAFKRHVIDVQDGPVPVMTFLKHAANNEFDPYLALLRTSDDSPVGHADFVEVGVPAGRPFGHPYRKRVLGLGVGPVLWCRDRAFISRTVFVPNVTLSNRTIVPARRISKMFGSPTFSVKGMNIEQQTDQMLSQCLPTAKEAATIAGFREQIIDGATQVAEALSMLPRPMSRADYDRTCRRLRIVPLADDVLWAVKGADRGFPAFPNATVESTIVETVHLYRRWAIDGERLP